MRESENQRSLFSKITVIRTKSSSGFSCRFFAAFFSKEISPQKPAFSNFYTISSRRAMSWCPLAECRRFPNKSPPILRPDQVRLRRAGRKNLWRNRFSRKRRINRSRKNRRGDRRARGPRNCSAKKRKSNLIRPFVCISRAIRRSR